MQATFLYFILLALYAVRAESEEECEDGICESHGSCVPRGLDSLTHSLPAYCKLSDGSCLKEGDARQNFDECREYHCLNGGNKLSWSSGCLYKGKCFFKKIRDRCARAVCRRSVVNGQITFKRRIKKKSCIISDTTCYKPVDGTFGYTNNGIYYESCKCRKRKRKYTIQCSTSD